MLKPVLNLSRDTRLAKSLYGHLSRPALALLKNLITTTKLSVANREIICIGESWFVTHSGLLSLAKRRRCLAIHSEHVMEYSDPKLPHWVFKATVYRSRNCKGFVGYGDADRTNTPPSMRGSELRIAETRAVNRALRKAYGIGICSVEELGSATPQARQGWTQPNAKKLPPQSSKGSGNSGHGSNGNGARIRDRLCQLIRQHTLDAELVKAYAVDFCGTKTLRDASREQVENFVAHLADWAEKDRNALLCQLNSYIRPAAGAA